jgi:hypothetical protein
MEMKFPMNTCYQVSGMEPLQSILVFVNKIVKGDGTVPLVLNRGTTENSSVSRIIRFTRGENVPDTQRIGGLVHPRAGLDITSTTQTRLFVSLALQPSAGYGFFVPRGFLITQNDASYSV